MIIHDGAISLEDGSHLRRTGRIRQSEVLHRVLDSNARGNGKQTNK